MVRGHSSVILLNEKCFSDVWGVIREILASAMASCTVTNDLIWTLRVESEKSIVAVEKFTDNVSYPSCLDIPLHSPFNPLPSKSLSLPYLRVYFEPHINLTFLLKSRPFIQFQLEFMAK